MSSEGVQALILFVGGLTIFLASLVYAREVRNSKMRARQMHELQRRAVAAGELPPSRRREAFEAISRDMRALSNPGSRDGANAVGPPNQTAASLGVEPDSGALLESIERLERQLTDSDERADSISRDIHEQLSRLRQQVAVLERRHTS